MQVRGVIFTSGLAREIFTAGNDLAELYAPKTSLERYTEFWTVSTTFLARLLRSPLVTVSDRCEAHPLPLVCCFGLFLSSQGRSIIFCSTEARGQLKATCKPSCKPLIPSYHVGGGDPGRLSRRRLLPVAVLRLPHHDGLRPPRPQRSRPGHLGAPLRVPLLLGKDIPPLGGVVLPAVLHVHKAFCICQRRASELRSMMSPRRQMYGL